MTLTTPHDEKVLQWMSEAKGGGMTDDAGRTVPWGQQPHIKSEAKGGGMSEQGRYQACPVCFGKGVVPPNFYLSPGPLWSATSATPEKCRSCDGRGIVR